MRRVCILLAVMTLLGSGCRSQGSRLAFYFIRTDNRNLADVELEQTPFLTDADILSYRWKSQVLSVRANAISRFPSSREVGTGGKQFVVVADRVRCWRGAFWSMFSSLGYRGPVILSDQYNSRAIVIHEIYPTGDGPDILGAVTDEKGVAVPDLRNDKRVHDVLKSLGKLRK